MNQLVYRITTGELLDMYGDPDTGGEYIGRGWAGRQRLTVMSPTEYRIDNCTNNPEFQNLHDFGPLPVGRYRLEAARDDDKLGPIAIPLTPLPNEGEPEAGPYAHMHGRFGFFIHDYAPEEPSASSDGCIVLPHAAREQLAKLAGQVLEVIS